MNWSDIITKIQSHGVTQDEIASEVGTSQGHISDILAGRRGNLRFELGQNLTAMLARLERKARKAA